LPVHAPRTGASPELLHSQDSCTLRAVARSSLVRRLLHARISHARRPAPGVLRRACAAVLALATETSIIPALPPTPRIQLAAGLLQCIIVRGRDA